MKKTIGLLLFLGIAVAAIAGSSSQGFTGLIDFPTAYNLRISNYTVGVIVDHIEEDTQFGVMLEGGFIPQIEAGIKLSTESKLINKELLRANFKYQFVQEADNPAMAIGFVEADDVFGYLVMTKSFKTLLGKEMKYQLTGGIKYDEFKDTNFFLGSGLPIFQNITILGEVYTFREKTLNSKNEIENNTRVSFNIAGEFHTNDVITTKVFWRESTDSVGISIVYLGKYK